ncbi:TIGR02117 family protein [Pontibacterium sp.]|uniref:TIGR02117 family protein n=1 Tax=Pontibacterium sp. TaxID=2036026 RepID=UPI0035156C71
MPVKIAFVLAIAMLMSACSSNPHVVHHPSSFTDEGSIDLYIVSHGWHTGFVIPADEIQARLPELKDRFPNTPYIEFGWGDKGFYQAEEITSGLTFRAIFWPTPSVIHAVAVPDDVESYFGNSEVEKLCLTNHELASLIDFVEGSFHKDENGNIIPLKNGIYGNSQFYQGMGDYYLMNTCNTWTAKGLKSIGMDITPMFKLTASSVMTYLQNRDRSPSGTSNPIACVLRG